MKKIKILSLLMALLLSSSLLLASCGSKKDEETESESESETEIVVEEVELTKYGIADIMNPSYDSNITAGVLSAIKDPSPYVGSYVTSNYDFMVTDDLAKLYVYNVATDAKVELEYYEEKLNEDATKASFKLNYVDIISRNYYAVLTMSYTEDADPDGDYDYSDDWTEFPESGYKSFYETQYDVDYNMTTVPLCNYTITVYGADGAVVRTYGNAELYARNRNASAIPNVWEDLCEEYLEEYSEYKADLFVKDGAVYRMTLVDGAPKYELVKDFGIAAIPKFDEKVGDYYLYSTNGTYTVYNKDLSIAYTYTVPSDVYDAYDAYDAYILSNGSLLVQYEIQLDQYATDYDYRSGSEDKYDLVTLIVNADGEKELEDVDYYIYDLKTSVADEFGKMYSDKVENLAFICPIAEDKTLDKGLGNRKLVLLSNDCEITAEVEIASDMIDFPIVMEKGLYAVETIGSRQWSDEYRDYTFKFNLYNAEGKMINSYETEFVKLDEYTVTEKGIYDINGTLLYDAKKNNAKVIEEGDAIYILTYGEGTENYSLFLGADNIVTIGSKVIGDDNAATVEKKVDELLLTELYYFTYIKGEGEAKNKTVYYNVKGEAIATFEEKGENYSVNISFVNDDFVIFVESYLDEESNFVYKYYKAPIVK